MEDQEPDVVGWWISSFLLFTGSVAILLRIASEASA
jgi:hypothetical protein